MTITSEVRKRWRENWLARIQELADADLQRRMWLDPDNGNPHWSYVELMCSYFDDTSHGAGYHWAIAEDLLTMEEAAIVAPLHSLLDQHVAPGKNDYDNEAVLNDPGWTVINNTAKRTVLQLAAALTDRHERDVLLGKA